MSEKRKKLATRAAVEALFDQYVRDWLPQQGPALARLRAWLEVGESVALTCFERAPGDCHRNCVAEALVHQALLQGPRVDVTHL